MKQTATMIAWVRPRRNGELKGTSGRILKDLLLLFVFTRLDPLQLLNILHLSLPPWLQRILWCDIFHHRENQTRSTMLFSLPKLTFCNVTGSHTCTSPVSHQDQTNQNTEGRGYATRHAKPGHVTIWLIMWNTAARVKRSLTYPPSVVDITRICWYIYRFIFNDVLRV